MIFLLIHHCAVAVNVRSEHQNVGTKRRGYECDTHFDDRGFPVYEKLKEDDFFIHPHNRKILLDWNHDGHCNVEYSAGVKCILYLFKYLFKGPKKASFSIEK